MDLASFVSPILEFSFELNRDISEAGNLGLHVVDASDLFAVPKYRVSSVFPFLKTPQVRLILRVGGV